MPQTLSFNLVHLIFSTKDRRPFLNDAVCSGLHAYLATVVRDRGSECFRVGGVEDHVHLAVRLHPTISLAKLLQELKANSSKWMKAQSVEEFAWQRGYAAFSVGPSDCGALVAYIEAQKTHHEKRDFKAEMRALFAKYGVAYDEKYVWD